MSETSTYFHRSRDLLVAGTVLQPTGLPQNETEIEDAFERLRPKELLSRKSAVFMTASPDTLLNGVDGQHVYRVEPLGEILSFDNGWYGQLQKAKLKMKYPDLVGMARYPDWTQEFVDDCVQSYWQGLPSPSPNWEYLARGAKIISGCFGENASQTGDT